MTERARAKAPKAIRTSDVARPRMLAFSALGASAGVVVAVLAEGTPLAAERPIARPHRKVACASCHGDEAARSGPVQDLLVALKRAGKLSKADMACLLVNYLRERKQGV